MSKYKKSSKRISERVMPFKVEKNFLNIALKYLQMIDINKYAKLDKTCAKDKVAQFKL